MTIGLVVKTSGEEQFTITPAREEWESEARRKFHTGAQPLPIEFTPSFLLAIIHREGNMLRDGWSEKGPLQNSVEAPTGPALRRTQRCLSGRGLRVADPER